MELINVPHNDDNMPLRNRARLWGDPKGGALYRWGGDGAYANTSDNDNIKLWKLDIGDGGGGTWGTPDPVNPFVFAEVNSGVRTFATVCDGAGYTIGGYATSASDARFYKTPFGQGSIPLPGVVSYDMESRTWANDSSMGWNAHGRGRSGAAVCLEGGSNISDALLLMLGGQSTNLDSADDAAAVITAINNITIYDPTQKRWHYQETTGDLPTNRENFCAVVAQSLNGTFEM